MKQMNIYPYVGIDSIKFGMNSKEVRDVLGEPNSVSTSGLGEEEENYEDMTIRYCIENNKVVEISFDPDSGVMLDGEYLYSQSNLTKYLLFKDPNPVECYGFLIFLGLGIATTGFHDFDEDQKAISIFSKGRWSSMQGDFITYRK